MTSYAVIAEYTEIANGTAEFPEGKTWDDVESHFVKWDTLHVKFKDEREWQAFMLNSSSDSEWKRPRSVDVMHTDEDGHPDFDLEPLASE